MINSKDLPEVIGDTLPRVKQTIVAAGLPSFECEVSVGTPVSEVAEAIGFPLGPNTFVMNELNYPMGTGHEVGRSYGVDCYKNNETLIFGFDEPNPMETGVIVSGSFYSTC